MGEFDISTLRTGGDGVGGYGGVGGGDDVGGYGGLGFLEFLSFVTIPDFQEAVDQSARCPM